VLSADDLGDDALGTATISYLIIYIDRNLKYASSISSRLFSAENLRAPEDSVYLIATIQATLYLSPTLYDKQTVTATLL
jgi:hypothetical protein